MTDFYPRGSARCPGLRSLRPTGLALCLATAALAAGLHASAPALAAESAEVATLSLSLADALSRAMAAGPDLVRAENEGRSIDARRAGAALWFPSNPYATFLFGPRNERQPDGSTLSALQWQLHVEQTFEIAGQRWARLDAVAAAGAAQRDQIAYARRSVETQIKGLYVQCLLSAQRVQVAVEREAISRQLLESAQTRVKLGAAGEIEGNLAQIEVGRVVGERRETEVERESRLAELRMLTAIPPTTALALSSLELARLPAGLPDSLRLADLVERAYAARGDLRAIYKQKEVLSAENRRLLREIVPNPVLSFDWQKDLDGQVFIGGTVGLSLPLWNRSQGGLAQVRAAEKNRVAEQQLLLNRIAAEVGQAVATLSLRRSQVDAFLRDAVPPAERNVDLLRRGWQAGKFDLFRVITALREQAEVRTRYLLMLEQLWLSAISLERAVGESLFTQAQAAPSGSAASRGTP